VKVYLKSDLRFHGVTQPQLRRAAREFVKASPDLTRAELRAIVDALYATGYHDLQSAVIALLDLRGDLLGPRDAPWLIGLVRKSPGWAHVDWLASSVIGPSLGDGATMRGRVRAWARHRDVWVRRTALLARHDELRRGRGDFALFAEIAAPLLEEREFWIRKAIGWVLREVSKKRPALVRDFLREHRARVSGLTLSEGAKYLPGPMRVELGVDPVPAWRRREAARGAR
jgi:3-methyladenine DNA glycosylase AlkD